MQIIQLDEPMGKMELAENPHLHWAAPSSTTPITAIVTGEDLLLLEYSLIVGEQMHWSDWIHS